LRLTRSALSLTLWIDPTEHSSDWEVIHLILRDGDIFVDIGAHIGHLSLCASQIVGPKGHVYAFEAHARTFCDLLENISINNATNIRAANIAISNTAGWTRFSDQKTANDQNKIDPKGSINVIQLPLDHILAEIEKIDLLKIDVEGFEKFVLDGAKLLLTKTSYILFEAWDRHFQQYGYSFSDIYDYLSQLGFIVGILEDGNFKPVSRQFLPKRCMNMVAYNKLLVKRPRFLE
jgi:FkbM family methyltransferase